MHRDTASVDVVERLRQVGDELDVAGNAPFSLHAGDAAWLVLAGKVEIFAVHGDDPHRSSRRTHLATIVEGELLFSVESGSDRTVSAPARGGESLALLAVAQPETRLLRFRRRDIRELGREPEATPRLARMVDSWISGLLRDVVPVRPPRSFTELGAGAEVTLGEDGEVARTRRGVLWVRHVAGTTRFLGRDELELGSGDFLVPISEETWLEGDAGTVLSCVDCAIVLRGGGVWESLDRFHRLFTAYVDLLLVQGERSERARLGDRAELDRSTMEGAYGRLAAILSAGAGQELDLDEQGDPLLAAVRRVAEAQGIKVGRVPEGATLDPRRRLSRLLDTSRVRHRRVLLRDDWWKRDNGPLVAFVGGDGEPERPVALIPPRPGSYEAVDPATGRRSAVDEELAELLSGEAYMLYRPLPDRPLTKGDLIRAALGNVRGDLVTVFLMGLAGGLQSLLAPIVTGYLFGSVVPAADRSRLVQMTLALVVAALAAAAFQITRSIAVLRISGKIDGRVQAAVWDRLLSLPVPFFREYTVGDLADRAMGADAIRQLLTGHVTTAVLSAVFSLFSFGLLFYYSRRLALVATGLVLVLSLSTTVMAFLQVRFQRRFLESRGKVASLLFGLISGISKLRVAGAEPRAFALWAERFAEQRRSAISAQRIAIAQATFGAAFGLLSALSLFAMAALSLAAELPVSHFIAFNATYGQFQSAALATLSIIPSLVAVVPTYERLRPILEAVPEVDASKAEVDDFAGDLEFSHIRFRYHSEQPLILDDVSFHARRGEFIALVGASGAGKSTCLRLILGFEEAEAGSIYFDGRDLGSLDLASLRRQIGVVLQNSRPMAGDIFSNIVGSRNLTLDDAWEAARMAGLDEDIRAMPMGMHTVISEGAATFSGGQVQRLLIARAVAHRPRILVFDEATSALDNRTQETVSRSLENLKATRIVVAHRLSTIRNADRIYVFDAGRIPEHGSYEELMERGGLFYTLARRQTA